MKRVVPRVCRRSFLNRSGFTIVEIVIIIAVIGILTTMATLGFNVYQRDARNNHRNADVTALSEALEKYYDESGEYPPCSAINGDPETVVATVLVGLDAGALKAPAMKSEVSSLSCASPGATGMEDGYSYVTDASSNCQAELACYSWTLSYAEEGSGDIVEIKSRRSGEVSHVQYSKADAETFCATLAAPSGYIVINVAGGVANGTSGNDFIIGSASGDAITGGAGDDIICGLDSGDTLDGGDGNDVIVGGAGGDELIGGAGNDLLVAGDGTDAASGGAGNDVIYGGLAADELSGDEGSDEVYGEENADLVYGGVDNDLVDGGAGSDQVEGNDGDDILYGGDGVDMLSGGNGYDRANDTGGAGQLDTIEEIF